MFEANRQFNTLNSSMRFGSRVNRIAIRFCPSLRLAFSILNRRQACSCSSRNSICRKSNEETVTCAVAGRSLTRFVCGARR